MAVIRGRSPALRPSQARLAPPSGPGVSGFAAASALPFFYSGAGADADGRPPSILLFLYGPTLAVARRKRSISFTNEAFPLYFVFMSAVRHAAPGGVTPH